jgi:hypothetical protein
MRTNLVTTGLKVEMARDATRHVKKTLPPSLSGFSGMAEIEYFIKATVIRPQFYKENIRAVCPSRAREGRTSMSSRTNSTDKNARLYL